LVAYVRILSRQKPNRRKKGEYTKMATRRQKGEGGLVGYADNQRKSKGGVKLFPSMSDLNPLLKEKKSRGR
jgi:hypothetical protein